MSNITEKLAGLKSPLFLATVAVPTFISILYFGLFASNVYMSESRFMVQSSDKGSSGPGLGMLLKASGFSTNSGEAYVTRDYILSRDALKAVNSDGLVARAYTTGGDASIFNRFNPLGQQGVNERLYRFYVNKLEIVNDSASAITTLRVRAFTPQDAKAINERLLQRAEEVVNRLNQRGRGDLIDYANKELGEAKVVARDAAVALSNYRNRSGVVDPQSQATVQLQMISKLQDELIATKTELVQLRAFTPQNPQIPVLTSRIAQLGREIDSQMGQIAGDRTSLAATAAEYQRLQLESEVADKQLGAAIASYQEARNEARRKRAYIERIAEPSLPDSSDEPKRLRGILSTLVIGLVAWGILTMLTAGIREHRD
ncbi:capsular polysaccharide transport system permease protein [Sphingobium sp. AP50]|uniref:hypothetical protein n=1 Tax=Sphingobium sp. AP50 TaxID=1884369 RepID=UPI0008AB9A52|nr:hypothetical protein [Sphingobium sp. AP50]SEJ78711.1 capsular polysaccharide transport system permease protein [Sphingobium sp. AP50]